MPASPRRLSPVTLSILVTLLCIALDAALLAALPALHLSYGPIGIALLVFALFRLGVLVLVLLFIFAGKALKRPTSGFVILVILLQVGLLLMEGYALYIEPFSLGVTDLPVSAPAFLPDRPLRILHLTDIHVEHPTRREAHMLQEAASLRPDLIVMTGDYLNPTYYRDPQSLQETRAILSQLSAPLGVYAVNGTVDDASVMSAVFDGLGNIHVLDNEVASIPLQGGTLYLLGLTDEPGKSRVSDGETLARMMASLPADAYTLLLYHTPDQVGTAASLGVDLYLAGHTHGGQVRLPFYGALITFSEFGKRYEMGEYHVGPTTLYVSRGIGVEGWNAPRLRFLCPPEMLLIELAP